MLINLNLSLFIQDTKKDFFKLPLIIFIQMLILLKFEADYEKNAAN